MEYIFDEKKFGKSNKIPDINEIKPIINKGRINFVLKAVLLSFWLSNRLNSYNISPTTVPNKNIAKYEKMV